MPSSCSVFWWAIADSTFAQDYDILLKSGHVIDGRSQTSAVRDVAIKDGIIAAVSLDIPSTSAAGGPSALYTIC